MLRTIALVLPLSALLLTPLSGATHKRPAHKKSTTSVKSHTVSKSRGGKSKAAAAKSGKGGKTVHTARGKSRKGKAGKSAPAVARQSAPTPDRYKEIQAALAQRGYYKGDPSGAWGPESVEALKKFQQEQNLAPSGKLDSVSLIALGLGPKRNLAARSGSDPTLPRPQDDHRSSQGSERP